MSHSNRALQILAEVGALLTNGHFLYTSGRHGNAYVNKDAVYPHTAQIRALCAEMAEPFVDAKIDTVAGPTIGGVILSQWVAHILSERTGHPVMACFAEERVDAAGERERFFGRGYDTMIRGKRVLLVEDILTTGGSIQRVVEAVKKAGGTPVAVMALCNRGGVTGSAVGVERLEALCSLDLQSWEPENCPLCRQGIPINDQVGKGKKP